MGACVSKQPEVAGRRGQRPFLEEKGDPPPPPPHEEVVVPSRKRKESDFYPVGPGGLVVVCSDDDVERRPGNERDVTRIWTTYTGLGWDIKVLQGFTKSDLEDHVRQISGFLSRGSYSCLDLFIMCHGILDGSGVEHILDSRDERLRFRDVFYTPLTNARVPETFRGRPVRFLVQACRGGGKNFSIPSRSSASDLPDHDASAVAPAGSKGSGGSGYVRIGGRRIPADADRLILWSTVRGMVSYRNPVYGSRFVQSYCDVISEDPSLDENEMRHRVNDKMDRWPTADPRDIQVAEVTCMNLRKYLRYQSQDKKPATPAAPKTPAVLGPAAKRHQMPLPALPPKMGKEEEEELLLRNKERLERWRKGDPKRALSIS